jgi:hypothetical protein
MEFSLGDLSSTCGILAIRKDLPLFKLSVLSRK